MSEISNLKSIERRIKWKRGDKKQTNRTLGIILTGEYAGLDEHLIEAEVEKHFDIDTIKEIISVGKREKTFKYANRFGKKMNLSVTATPLENYTWDDIDLPIKRNSIIIYDTDDVIIFHGDKEQNTVAWYALSSATRVIGNTGKAIFINAVPKPILYGFEKEIFDVIQMQHVHIMLEDAGLMEMYYFELRQKKLTSFSKHVQLGEKMDFKDVLLKITELSVKGQSEGVYDGISFVCDGLLNYLIPLIEKDFEDKYEDYLEGIASFILKYINPSYEVWDGEAEDDVCFVLLQNSWYQLEYLMLHIERDYSKSNENEEIYAALCYAKWLLIMDSRGIEIDEITRKNKNLENFVSIIR